MNILERPTVPLSAQNEATVQLRSNASLRRYIEAIVQREVINYFDSGPNNGTHTRMVAIIDFATMLLDAQTIPSMLPSNPLQQ